MTCVISFYSFKGGAGRTVCVANIAGYLAQALNATAEKPLLVIDMDLDSAGLTMLLGRHGAASDEAMWTSSRIIDTSLNLRNKLRCEKVLSSTMDITSDVGGENLGLGPGSVRFVRGESVGNEAVADREAGAIEEMEALIRYCRKKGFAGILIDSASGRQMSARLAFRVSELIVCCARLSYQFAEGTEQMIMHHMDEVSADRAQANPYGDEASILSPAIVFVPVAVPKTESEWANNVKQVRLRNFDRLVSRVLEKDPDATCRLFEAGIMEIERFKFHETVLSALGSDHRHSEDESALLRFVELSEFIAKIAQIRTEQLSRCAEDGRNL